MVVMIKERKIQPDEGGRMDILTHRWLWRAGRQADTQTSEQADRRIWKDRQRQTDRPSVKFFA